MNFDELATELKDRGFSDVSETRRKRAINAANAELDSLALWPWRQTDVTGTAPLTVTNLGPIEAVTNETRDYRLRARQYADLVDAYGDLTTSGPPCFYYRAYVSGNPVIATYPSNSDTIGVVHWKQTTLLVNSSDEPASPDEVHPLIVEFAVRMVAKDPERKALAQAEIDRRIPILMQTHIPGVADDEGHFIGGSGLDW